MLEVISDWFVFVYEQFYSTKGVYDTFASYNNMFYELLENDIFKAVSGSILAIGVGIMLIYFFIDLGDKVQEKNFSLNHFIRAMIMMLISYVLIVHSMDLMKGFAAFGQAIAGTLQDTGSSGDFFATHGEEFKKGIKDVRLLDSVGYMVKVFLPWIISVIASIIVTYLAVSRIVEMTVRCIFAPIAVADCFKDGSRSNGIRYFKKFLAIALQFALIVGISVGVSFIMAQMVGADAGTDLTNILVDGNFNKESCTEFLDKLLGGDDYILLMGLLCAKIGLMIKSMSIANDIVGV